MFFLSLLGMHYTFAVNEICWHNGENTGTNYELSIYILENFNKLTHDCYYTKK